MLRGGEGGRERGGEEGESQRYVPWQTVTPPMPPNTTNKSVTSCDLSSTRATSFISGVVYPFPLLLSLLPSPPSPPPPQFLLLSICPISVPPPGIIFHYIAPFSFLVYYLYIFIYINISFFSKMENIAIKSPLNQTLHSTGPHWPLSGAIHQQTSQGIDHYHNKSAFISTE